MPPIRELPSLKVTIDKLLYRPELEAPSERPHPFAYYITIENQSEETVTIKGRKWIVTERDSTVVVEGDGVVGRFPCLEPGESFSYHSYHVVATDAYAEGAFLGITDKGEPVVTRIPRFYLIIPRF